ncbi:aspartate--tRNA ligase [Candidatus Riesia pediculischaeffi]|uniref:Aspartate--tRNA ligase n=1 Tax=Candidatus Riesia pediculischaeffi PTSU TaxID=1401651 RepID=A0A0C1V5R3_9ENTR|nr:aspartate--tRNA ligase [Candidatus Riesia pediculischaeffi]KIE63759.1 Aspartyl-tRNA synthetase [Candidatus Riesia pediculischaeffi PTSU]
MLRTCFCGEINSSHVGNSVTILGWIYDLRFLKNLTFLNIRDRTGTVQAVCSKEVSPSIFLQSLELQQEFCITASGVVQGRMRKTKGYIKKDVEVIVVSLNILNTSKALPIDISFRQIPSEKIQLKYRYLYLRNPDITRILVRRSEITYFIHEFMNKNGFINIETPYLSNLTDGGAKDFLVPSRIKNNRYYALSQSPQMFKQMLMISGFERYYQIARCFRNEDSRSNRQPEFTQLDIEMSFISSKQIRRFIEEFICKLWKKFLGVDLPDRFPKVTFKDAVRKYGTDKPDLRNYLELVDITSLLQSFRLNRFMEYCSLEDNCILIHVKSPLKKTNTDCLKEYQNIGSKFKIKHFLFVEVSSNIIDRLNRKIFHGFLDMDMFRLLSSTFHLKDGDMICIGIGKKSLVNRFMGNIRLKIGEDLNITKKNIWKPVWIVDFPMFKKEESGSLKPTHHVFTSPKSCDLSKLRSDPTKVISDSYDMVINGQELGSGSVRIYKREIQKEIFKILQIEEKDQISKFGFLLDAMQYGAPPHAGFAFGLDRIVMIMLNQTNIKNVIAFPKTTSASCLMTNAPSKITG